VNSDEPDRSTPAQPGSEPDPQETFAQAVRRSAFGHVTPGQTPTGADLLRAMGGVRGIVESLVPGLAFLVIYAITREVLPSVLIPLGLAVIFVVVRAVMRQPWRPAVMGVVLLGVSAGLALLTGRAEDNFVVGFVINAVFLVALVLSLVVRRPLVGVIASLLTGDGASWRGDRARLRVAVIGTFLWCGLFALRLAVELPLYFLGNAAGLATAKLLLGIPFYAAVLWATWLLMRTAWSKSDDGEPAA
jgi:hypothetical protein